MGSESRDVDLPPTPLTTETPLIIPCSSAISIIASSQCSLTSLATQTAPTSVLRNLATPSCLPHPCLVASSCSVLLPSRHFPCHAQHSCVPHTSLLLLSIMFLFVPAPFLFRAWASLHLLLVLPMFLHSIAPRAPSLQLHALVQCSDAFMIGQFPFSRLQHVPLSRFANLSLSSFWSLRLVVYLFFRLFQSLIVMM